MFFCRNTHQKMSDLSVLIWLSLSLSLETWQRHWTDQHIRCRISIYVQPKSLNPWYHEFKAVAHRCTSTLMRVFNSFHICLIKPKASFHSSFHRSRSLLTPNRHRSPKQEIVNEEGKNCGGKAPQSSGNYIWIGLIMHGGGQIHFFLQRNRPRRGVDHIPLNFLLRPQASLRSWGWFHRSLFRIEAEAAPGQMLPVHGVLFCPIRPIVLQPFKSPDNYTFLMGQKINNACK